MIGCTLLSEEAPSLLDFLGTFLYLLVYSADGALRENLATSIWAKKCKRLTFTGGDEEGQEMRDREAGKGTMPSLRLNQKPCNIHRGEGRD